jgi:hypothetical protein
MSRMRTCKKQFAIVSNDTAQKPENGEITLQALGLLTYCLSKPENWEFCPKAMVKSGITSKNRLYKLFNELIEAGHCIRIYLPNPKVPHIKGAVSYEIFDDILACEDRCKELFENTSYMIECSLKFKKCLRYRQNSELKLREHKKNDIYKERDNKERDNKKTLPPPTPPKFEPEKKANPKKESLRSEEEDFSIYKILEETTLSPKQKKRLTKEYSEEQVTKAIKISKTQNVKKSLMGLLLNILDNPEDWPDKPDQLTLTPKQQLALQYNLQLSKTFPKFAKQNEQLILKENILIIYENKSISRISLDSDYFEQDLKNSLRELETS